MSRTLKTLAFLSVATLLSVACERTPPARPNVVLIVIDTQRAQNLSLYGYERDTSPEFTRFAHEALTFELATAPGTWTVPTHASLFTGRWPSFHGAERVGVDGLVARPMNPEIPTLAELLQRDGYTTAAFVANVTYLSPLFGFQRGFDQFTNDLDWPRADHVATAVNDWLESQQAPFFLFVNLLDPHEPYEPPEPFDTRFDGKNPEHGTMMTEKMHARVRFTDEMRAHFVSQYDGETAFTDQALGTILDTLRARPDYGNSVVIVTSDHGEMLGEHQLAGHVVEPYEPELHVPLVAKLAGGRRAGERVEDRVSTMGVFATILDAVGIPLPEGTQAVRLTETTPGVRRGT